VVMPVCVSWSLLDDIFCIVFVAHETSRQPMGCLPMWQDDIVETLRSTGCHAASVAVRRPPHHRQQPHSSRTTPVRQAVR
jgi:hypothetical protein